MPPTEANRAYLAASFLEEVQARYGGTSQGAQELEGLLIEDVQGALWQTKDAGEGPRRCRPAPWPHRGGGRPAGHGPWRVGRMRHCRRGRNHRRPAAELARRGAGGCHGHRGQPRTMGAGGTGCDGPARRRPSGGRGQSGRRSGRRRDPPDRPLGALPRRAGQPGQGRAGRAGLGALRTGPRLASAPSAKARGADVPDDGAGLSRQGLARPRRCAWSGR